MQQLMVSEDADTTEALRILVLSAHEDTIHPKRALKAGAAGYLTKRSAAEELIQAIRDFGIERRFETGR